MHGIAIFLAVFLFGGAMIFSGALAQSYFNDDDNGYAGASLGFGMFIAIVAGILAVFG